ncbi:DUF3108 domain-containing protein [Ornithobacterium rhinotracheale]|uniref:DUF3108 domain-containing protein n=1 Tax=Ornithobacterium rhinotracheale TaxID=28251 RepID=UPI00129CE891|nr:DUF3108 domain-containing protein [Ornithobacterium rhinotracheale]MRJ08092.1 DUF3108 domain-containing protein [Ornithobacterium rhinotracheale]UOH78400.1 DUF3108 domain-containing protein [Ornithobacterium rhinotracheale]
MKKLYFIVVTFLSFLLQAQGIADSEFLKYRVHYGFVNAGFATLKIKEVSYNGRPHWHVIGKGSSSGAVRVFFKVDDRYETYIDKFTYQPSKFVRNINEGGYTKNKTLTFDHKKRFVYEHNLENGRKTTYRYNTDVQDMLSAFYYLRTMANTDFAIGSAKTINVFMDGQIYPFKLKILGKENIKSKFGTIKCIKMRPYVQSGRVFKEQESVTIWVSDDANLIPIQLEAELAVGSLKMSLYEYKNIKTPLAFK